MPKHHRQRTAGGSLLAAGAALALCLPILTHAAQPDAPATVSPPPAASKPKCLEAIVSPVSGFAECVNPRGAPVEQVRRADVVPCRKGDAACKRSKERS